MTTVAVCVATLGRPEGLAALLRSLAAQQVPRDVELRIVVVDNDGAGSAARVVDAIRAETPLEIRYAIEPTRGIPFARNRAVSTAGDVDWFAFVDDDETVGVAWIAELLRVGIEHDADVVTGPVLPVFEVPPPPWVRHGAFFDRERHPTGTLVRWARTSNALVAARQMSTGKPFNEAMGNNGGDDTHFFQRVRLAHGTMVWADGAVVSEVVPATRVSTRWLLRRSFRRGNTLSLCLRDLEDSPRRRAKRLAAACYHTAAGLALAASGVVTGRAAAVRGLQRIWFAVGLVTGLFGHSYQEYRVVHGR